MSAVVQRTEALQRANEIRHRRSVERRELRALGVGQAIARLGELLLDCPDWLSTVPVGAALCWLPHWGPSRATRLLAPTGVRGARLIGELTDRQRRLLARSLGHREITAEEQR